MKRLLAAGLAVGVASLAVLAAVESAAAQTTLRFGKIPSTVRNVGCSICTSPSARASSPAKASSSNP